MSSNIPDVTKCCLCVTDLKTAVIIIAVLGIVTCPAVSWAAVRHTYTVRVSCMMTMYRVQPDVYDIKLHNILSYGLGANAGSGKSCFNPNTTHSHENNLKTLEQNISSDSENASSSDANSLDYVTYFGCIVLLADMVFLLSSIVFLVKIFKRMDNRTSKVFMYAATASICSSFLYAMCYIIACSSTGIGFPMFELFFAIVDLVVWVYFVIVIKSYRNTVVHI